MTNVSPISFPDVNPTSWGAYYISLASQLSIVTGNPDGNFRGTSNVTRSEFAAMVVRALHLDTSDSSGSGTFLDTKGHWAEDAIITLEKAGVIMGTGNGYFKPDKPISRAEISAILARIMDMSTATTNYFSDTTNYWAQQYIEQLHNAGIVYGKSGNMFGPKENASREESVAMIIRMLNVTLDLGLDV